MYIHVRTLMYILRRTFTVRRQTTRPTTVVPPLES
jgi:hypothetical protein